MLIGNVTETPACVVWLLSRSRSSLQASLCPSGYGVGGAAAGRHNSSRSLHAFVVVIKIVSGIDAASQLEMFARGLTWEVSDH